MCEEEEGDGDGNAQQETFDVAVSSIGQDRVQRRRSQTPSKEWAKKQKEEKREWNFSKYTADKGEGNKQYEETDQKLRPAGYASVGSHNLPESNQLVYSF